MRIKGQTLSAQTMRDIELTLNLKFSKAGFITDVSIVNSCSIKIGLWMCTFRLDTTKHDRNLQCNPYQKKLTTLPNWDQRVKFNNIVNATLNSYKVSANIKSGPYTIREGKACMTEYEWQDQKPSYVYSNESKGYFIESVNEKQFIEERRLARNRKANEKRAQANQRIQQRPHLVLAGAQ